LINNKKEKNDNDVNNNRNDVIGYIIIIVNLFFDLFLIALALTTKIIPKQKNVCDGWESDGSVML
jgi:hypothetical protein